MTRLLMIVLTWLTMLAEPAMADKTFVTLNGKVMTCKDAVAFRDGPLADEWAAIQKSYSQPKADRQKALREELTKHIASLKQEWEKASEAHKRVIRTKAGLFVLGAAAKKAGDFVQKLPNLSETEKKGVGILMGKGEQIVNLTANSGTASLGASDVAKMIPASFSFILTGTAAHVVALAFLTDAGVDFGFALWDKSISDDAFSGEIKVLEESLAKLVERSSDIQIARVNAIKNNIDATCK